MIHRKKIVRVLASLLLIALLWVVFLLIRGLFERSISHHEQFIPENAESVLEIKSEPLIRSFLEDILAEGTLDERFNEFTKSSDDSEPLGIDYLSNCYLFTFQKDDDYLMGILVNVLDENQFKKAMNESSTAGFGYGVSNGVGVMIYDLGVEPRSAQHLNTVATQLTNTPSKFDLSLLDSKEKNAKANYWAKEYDFNNDAQFKELHLSLTLNGNKLKIVGDAKFSSAVSKRYPILEPNDLSIQTQFIPNSVNKWWTGNSKSLGLKFPKLIYVSGNYHYSEPSPIKELKVLPNFDGVYVFEENFQIRIPLVALMASQKINSLDLKSFQIGNTKIYYEQINPKTVYLGQSPYRASTNEENALFEVKGDLKQLLEIRNGGMVERFLKLSPEYNATRRFLSNIDESNFYVREKDGKKVDILAEMTFEEGKSALNETIVLLMDLGLFE